MSETLLPFNSGCYVLLDTLYGSPRREEWKGKGLERKEEVRDGDYGDEKSKRNWRNLACTTEDTRKEL